jgi:Uma2 family endonuclease
MALSSRHEEPNRTLGLLVELVAGELGIDFRQLGSTTFQREDLRKGFEPDSAYYLAHASAVAGREVDPALDPPPDLAIDVEVASPSLNRFPIFAAFGVPEVWRYDGSCVTIYLLQRGRYVESASSSALPLLTAQIATSFLEQRRHFGSTRWMRHVRDWARQQS